MGVLSTHHVGFLEFFPRNRHHHHFSDDVGCHEFQLVCHCEVEDEAAAGGFPRGSLYVIPPSSLPIDMVIEVFSSFELLIFSLTLLLFWTYRSQRLPRFRQASILHFEGMVLMRRQILVAVEDVSGAHQHTNEEPNVWRSVTVQLVYLCCRVFQERCDRKA